MGRNSWSLIAVGCIVVLLFSTHGHADEDLVPDPDYDSSAPTSWHWWLNQTEDQLNTMRNNGERIIDIERVPMVTIDYANEKIPGRFHAVLVKNTGAYQRTDSWWFDFDQDQVTAKINQEKGRIIDLEPYTGAGKRLFAFSLIRNEGKAAKSWWWNYDLTPDQVTADINTHGIRLIDLDAYSVKLPGSPAKTLYSYVGISNQGVDGKAWWWYPDVTAQFVSDRINEFGARLIDIEVHPNGNLAVVMVQNDGTAWWWNHGVTLENVSNLLATTASRLTDLEVYRVGGERTYAFISVGNTN